MNEPSPLRPEASTNVYDVAATGSKVDEKAPSNLRQVGRASKRARIAGIGTHLPERRASNADDLARFGLDDSFLTEKLGIHHRALKSAGDRTSDLCMRAVENLTQNYEIDLQNIGLLCVVTQNPDRNVPHTSAIVHQAIGLAKHCMTFDISQGCAGFTHGISIVTAMMHTHGIAEALLLTCDPYSDIVDSNDRNTALLFGDAATATYFSVDRPGYSMIDTDYGTIPGTSECLWTDHRLAMDGSSVLRNAALEIPSSIQKLLNRNSLSQLDIECFLLHPGSLRLHRILQEAIGVDGRTAPFEIEDYGNTVSSSIPLMLSSRLAGTPGKKLILSGFGVGFTWATTLVEFGNPMQET